MVKLLNISIKFSADRIINEKNDVFYPNIEHNIVGICTNFYKHFLSGYEPNKEIPVKSNRGRKKKIKVKKNNKTNNGMNDQFDSEITFYVIQKNYPGEVFSVKIFRKQSGDITGLKKDDDSEILDIINSVFNFINTNKPDINIRLISKSINLANDLYIGQLPEALIIKHPIYNNDIYISYQINLYKLKELLLKNKAQFNKTNDQKIEYLKIEYSGEKNYLILSIPLNYELINKKTINLDSNMQLYDYNLENYEISQDKLDAKKFKFCVIHIYKTYHIYTLGCQDINFVQTILDNIRDFIEHYKNKLFIPNYSLKNI